MQGALVQRHSGDMQASYYLDLQNWSRSGMQIHLYSDRMTLLHSPHSPWSGWDGTLIPHFCTDLIVEPLHIQIVDIIIAIYRSSMNL